MNKILVVLLLMIPDVVWADDWRVISGYFKKGYDWNWLSHGRKHRQHHHNAQCGHSARDRSQYYNRQGYQYSYYDWIRAQQFRTRIRHFSDPVIRIGVTIQAISLSGLKRSARIHTAYAELASGRVIPLANFKGNLRHGERVTKFFSKPRHVKKIVLKVSPQHRKRGYVGVDIMPIVAQRGRFDDY